MIKATGAVFFCVSKKPNPKVYIIESNLGLLCLAYREQMALQTREGANNQDALCFIFALECLRKWREVSGPITRNRERFKRGKT